MNLSSSAGSSSSTLFLEWNIPLVPASSDDTLCDVSLRVNQGPLLVQVEDPVAYAWERITIRFKHYRQSDFVTSVEIDVFAQPIGKSTSPFFSFRGRIKRVEASMPDAFTNRLLLEGKIIEGDLQVYQSLNTVLGTITCRPDQP